MKVNFGYNFFLITYTVSYNLNNNDTHFNTYVYVIKIEYELCIIYEVKSICSVNYKISLVISICKISLVISICRNGSSRL